jgi:hypothetical protein
MTGKGDRVPSGLHLVYSYRPFDHSRWKASLARMDGSRCQQSDRLRHCRPDRAVWIHTRECLLHCALFLQRVELAQPACTALKLRYDFLMKCGKSDVSGNPNNRRPRSCFALLTLYR